ncbi:MAG: 16S rRNA (adenine(1518)-N(6)/adenine(1519)-N(6))-dimethyltransferase RsmA [Mesotoga sp.]|nr:16S rRNA (adenine(1518)-N(6)/adenine(1519)-N(6))-dimethyltransferase RsmA [Mesotoga sp.]
MGERSINIRLNRALGQNFLKSAKISRRIVESASLDPSLTIVEIGVGSGSLTSILLELGYTVIGFEIDTRFVEGNKRLEGEKCTLRYEDFLKADLSSLPEPAAYVANIPYYITSPIIERIMFEGPDFVKAVLMVQKEYADRLIATPRTKEYGILTVNVNTFASVSELFQVSRKEFIPQPEVDSMVIELSLLDEPPIERERRDPYRGFVRQCFSQRRKKLKNNLKGLVDSPESLLKASEIGLDVRAEELDVEDFVRLFMNIYPEGGVNPKAGE